MSEFTSQSKLRVALVGCGRISKLHLAAIASHKQYFQLVGVCDIDQAARDDAAKQHHVPAFSQLAAMLTECRPDLVAICTPSGLHPEHAIIAAEAGCHVLCEKPIGVRWGDALEMLQACQQAGVNVFVVKQNRYNPTLQALKQAHESQRFGRIFMVNINVFWTRPQSYYDQAKWRGTWQYDGGAFMNQAAHYFDLLHWLFGPVASIQAMTATLARDIEAEDTGVVNLRWQSGALGSVNVTMLTHDKNFEGSITVIGEKGTVSIGGIALNEIHTWNFADMQDDNFAPSLASYATESVYGHGHQLYYKELIRAMQGEQTDVANGEDGLATLELIVAAYQSAREGAAVPLPLVRAPRAKSTMKSNITLPEPTCYDL